ncbi:GGDEF domain-containing protein [Catenovulum sp. SM1970]|uniref:GGDEF domain-containing protein n=1 Tax=Marinifaba aquimaris TaxID=2741323 RepID=UPI00157374EB|nr:GGDEF domain-containing protein [Marinifaba aquimaris]NTS78897.1 GGDEF domain-containing protein [Marinifaba aquimaris]
MNWQQLHLIFDTLTCQNAIGRLDTLAIDFLKDTLSDTAYRMYYNFHLRGVNALELVYANELQIPTEKELRLVEELGSAKCLHPNYFEEDDHKYFIVLVNEHCSFLLIIDETHEMFKPQLIQFVKTLCVVWQNQLEMLHYFQKDALTDLYNPNILTEAVNGNSVDIADMSVAAFKRSHALERRSAFNSADCIAMIDIDDFTLINERFSHTIGDEVLMKVARLLEITFRDSDMLCRYSGNTFAILIRHISHEGVKDVLERFKEKVAKTHFPRIATIQVSIGYSMTISGMLASELYERSIQAVKEAKSRGKNTIVNAADIFDDKPSSDIEVGEIELF